MCSQWCLFVARAPLPGYTRTCIQNDACGSTSIHKNCQRQGTRFEFYHTFVSCQRLVNIREHYGRRRLGTRPQPLVRKRSTHTNETRIAQIQPCLR